MQGLNRIRISPHFLLCEFECPCCHRVKLDARLIEVLEKVRAHIGKSVQVTSGYRCPEHNKAIGGAKDSDHLYGWAADIVVKGMAPEELVEVAANAGGIRLGTYRNRSCVHVGVQHRDGLPDRWRT